MWGDSQCLLMGMKNHSHGEGGAQLVKVERSRKSSKASESGGAH